jgi:hypothetical protein
MKEHLFFIILSFTFERLSRVLTLLYELVCQSPNLLVLEFNPPVIGDEQDPVIRYGFLTIDCPDAHAVWLQADVGTAYGGSVVRCTPVNIPDLDFPDVVAVIVPVLLKKFMAG